MPISITEEFADSRGRFLNYWTLSPNRLTSLQQTSHVDIRSFTPRAAIPANMGWMDLRTMTQLDGYTMAQLEDAIQPSENWTVGTVAFQANRNRWAGISLTCGTGTTTTSSVLKDPATATVQSIDISTGFLDSDNIVVSLASFPLASITIASSFIDFTSAADGSFSGTIASVAFSASTTTLAAGDCAFTFPRSSLAGINLAAITGVRFRIVATGACTVRVLALRLLGANWRYGSVDTDTLLHRLKRTVAPTASVSESFTSINAPQPPIYRAATPSDNSDPRPIDAVIEVPFNAGNLTNGNQFRVFFREQTAVGVLQSDLDGLTQSDLDSLGHQPDTTESPDADGYVMAEFDWQTTGALVVKASDTPAGQEYSFGPFALMAGNDYLWRLELQDTTFNATLSALDSTGRVTDPLWDSGLIPDSFMFKRRKGRVGYSAALIDGDTYLSAFRGAGTMFAEYRSRPYMSETAVSGMQAFVGATPPSEFFSGLQPGPYGGSINIDLGRSQSADGSIVIRSKGLSDQGIQTNGFVIEDASDTQVAFDLWVPDGLVNKIEACLISGFRMLPLTLPGLQANTWAHIVLDLSEVAQEQSGTYSFALLQQIRNDLPWWVDNISITSRTIAWAGRGGLPNPWDHNDPPWTPFDDTINTQTGGIVFAQRGKAIQLRGRALTQNATIQRASFVPKYATLGRFSWLDQIPVSQTVTINSATATFSGVVTNAKGKRISTYAFAATATAPGANRIISYFWKFGDGGTRYGATATHAYPTTLSRTYFWTLIVTDSAGDKAYASGSVTL